MVCVEVRGVKKVESGYSGGHVPNPTYRQVCSETTGHAEVVQVTFDPEIVSYKEILEVFFATHDPTTPNRQGADVGTQYRSAVFYRTPAQKAAVDGYLARLRGAHAFGRPIVTQVTPLRRFHEAEAYHQGYMARHPDAPYIVYNDAPKVARLKKQFPALYQG